MSLSVKLYTLLALVIALVGGGYFVYHHIYQSGYDASEAKYKPIIEGQKKQIAQLEEDQKKIAKEIVIEYRDRIKVVTKTVERIIHDTPEALKDETKLCTIGPNFIGLYNDAASSGAVPFSTSRSNGGTEGIKDLTGK